MRLFGLSLGVISLLSLELQSLSPALAQAACTVTAPTPSALMPTAVTSVGSMSKAVQSVGSQYFQVDCPGNTARSGSITLSLLSSTIKYNGIAKFRVSSTEGIFTTSTSEYSENPVTITIPTTSGDAPSGKVYYKVSITAPDGQVLRAATDYAVNIQAELNIN